MSVPKNMAALEATVEIMEAHVENLIKRVADLEAAFDAGTEVTLELLRSSGVAKGIWQELKILGDGNLSKSLAVSAHRFSKQAREKILAAGGSVTEVPGPAPVVKGQKKPAKSKQSASPTKGDSE